MKRGICLLLAFVFLLSLSFNTQSVLSQSDGDIVTRDTLYVPGQVIVGFDESVTVKSVPAQASALAGEVQAAVVKVQGSTALLEFHSSADVEALAEQIQSMSSVAYAEPNAVFWLPELVQTGVEPNQDFIIRRSAVEEGKQPEDLLVPISTLQSMKKRTGSKVQAVYPNDKNLWWNNGWYAVGADIVFPNLTPSKHVCVIDSGVDYAHPDLQYRIIKGKDFVNNDNNPMDDHGHGTHVAGVIAANQGNKIGIAGVSTGKVIAVKALTAQGWGTSFEIAQAIYYCANRKDVSVINMSLGGSTKSTTQQDAVDYAVNSKKKLIVAAAGNSDVSTKFYPAAFSVEYPNKVLSVAASGQYVEYDGYEYLDNWCKASYSNYGDWVDIIGPGTSIYSTLPWKKPSTLQWYVYYDGYGYLSGTSMAAPFVSAVAARAWGFMPELVNSQVSEYIKFMGDKIDTDCWPESNHETSRVNVAAALQRGAAYGAAFDANTGLPLTNAVITAFQYGVVRGSAQLTPTTFKYSGDSWTYYPAYADIVNLTASKGWWDYEARVHKSGYTATPQKAFVSRWEEADPGKFVVFSGSWTPIGEAFVPQRSTHFTATHHTMEWEDWSDLVTFLPALPKPVDDGQPARFIVSMMSGADFGNFEGQSIGNLSVFPYARHMIEGEFQGYGWDSVIVRSKPGFPARPYYTGEYVFAVQNPHPDSSTSFFIWKDGVIKKRVNLASDCIGSWWRPLTLSQASGAAVYTVNNYCGETGILPYTP
jgi:subtilisin family serine protease